MKDKDRILLAILDQDQSTEIRVTDIRDKFAAHYAGEAFDPAAMRRWVNGKCMTMVNKGVLIRKKLPGSKRYCFEKSSSFDQYFSDKTSSTPMQYQSAPNIQADKHTKSQALQSELESYRQTMLSQLGEIEEYKRIREEHPELGDAAAQQFKLVVDDNYRMLGRIRAIEKLMATQTTEGQLC